MIDYVKNKEEAALNEASKPKIDSYDLFFTSYDRSELILNTVEF